MVPSNTDGLQLADDKKCNLLGGHEVITWRRRAGRRAGVRGVLERGAGAEAVSSILSGDRRGAHLCFSAFRHQFSSCRWLLLLHWDLGSMTLPTVRAPNQLSQVLGSPSKFLRERHQQAQLTRSQLSSSTLSSANSGRELGGVWSELADWAAGGRDSSQRSVVCGDDQPDGGPQQLSFLEGVQMDPETLQNSLSILNLAG